MPNSPPLPSPTLAAVEAAHPRRDKTCAVLRLQAAAMDHSLSPSSVSSSSDPRKSQPASAAAVPRMHYAVQHCNRDVVKALLELGAAVVNSRSGTTGKTPLHLAAEMVSPDMVSELLDHHADPNARKLDLPNPAVRTPDSS